WHLLKAVGHMRLLSWGRFSRPYAARMLHTSLQGRIYGVSRKPAPRWRPGYKVPYSPVLNAVRLKRQSSRAPCGPGYLRPGLTPEKGYDHAEMASGDAVRRTLCSSVAGRGFHRRNFYGPAQGELLAKG